MRSPFFCIPARRVSRSARATARPGFALLVTIVLVAFLVLILVGLATFTRVETQVADNSQKLAQARQNALFALNLAVGQLQKHAGPDQRVTARADINPANTANPYWTGVWDSTPATPGTYRDSALAAAAAPTAWLVSGNETSPLAQGPTVDLSGSADATLLVSAARSSSATAVYAPLVDIKSTDLPGMGGVDTRMGRYAFWVGDEGVKAKLNPASLASAATASDSVQLHAPPRLGTEFIGTVLTGGTGSGDDSGKPALAQSGGAPSSDFAAWRTLSSSGTTADALRTAVAKVVDPEQAVFTDPSLDAAALRRRYHDITTSSLGVIADTLHGGLRRDFTRGLDSAYSGDSAISGEIPDNGSILSWSSPAIDLSARYNFTARAAAGGTPPLEAPDPTWGRLRSFFNLRVPSGGAVDSLAPVFAAQASASSSQPQGVFPVVVKVQLPMGATYTGTVYKTSDPAPPPPSSNLLFVVRPAVILANPYNVRLQSATYTVSVQPTNATNTTTNTPIVTRVGGLVLNKIGGASTLGTAYWSKMLYGESTAEDRELRLEITSAFEPGEVKVFTLAAPVTSVTNGVFQLAPGVTPNEAIIDSGVSPRNASGVDVRVGSASTAGGTISAQFQGTHPQIRLYGGAFGGATTPTLLMATGAIELESTYLNNVPPRRTARVDSPDTHELTAPRWTAKFSAFSHNTQGNAGTPITPSDTTSGLRWLADTNPRGSNGTKLAGWEGSGYYSLVRNLTAGTAYSSLSVDGDNAFWGADDAPPLGSKRVVLFDLLRSAPLSIGQLGHAALSLDHKLPAYPLGNSYASPLFTAQTADFSHALNEAVWDRFFLSTLPDSLSAPLASPANPRLVYHNRDGSPPAPADLSGARAYTQAAANLFIDGAFNVNSTSVEAWKALLASVPTKALGYYDTLNGASGTTSGLRRSFPRTFPMMGGDPDDPSNTGKQYEWTGARALTDGQVAALAEEIVIGIRARGAPSRSLAEFINRRPRASTEEYSGILQAAIDRAINNLKPGTASRSGDAGSSGYLPGLGNFAVGGLPALNNSTPAVGALRSAGAPGYLLQSDLLGALAPVLSARSDTFTVRALGEAWNPSTGQREVQAWLEATVQRVPDYVDQTDPALTTDGAATAPASANATNQAFGRRFKIVGFRWLTANDL